MSDEKCTGCGAPVSAASMVCEFCGKALKTPVGVEEELLLLRQQAEAAQRIGSADVGSDTEKQAAAAVRVAAFWGNAYVPTSVPALKSALEQCAALAPKIEYGGAKHKDFEVLQAFAARADGLALALDARSDSTENDREFAKRVNERIGERVSAYKKADRKHTIISFTLWGGLPIVGIVSLLSWMITHEANKSAPDECKELIGQCGASQWSRSSGGCSKGKAACAEACASGTKWACDMAENAKYKD